MKKFETVALEIANDFYEKFHDKMNFNDFDLSEQIEVYELHNEFYNQEYYIIGYNDAKLWLKRHNVDVFEALEYCNKSELETYGEIQTTFDNYETLANNFVYWLSLDVMIQFIELNDSMTLQDVKDIKISDLINLRNNILNQ